MRPIIYVCRISPGVPDRSSGPHHAPDTGGDSIRQIDLRKAVGRQPTRRYGVGRIISSGTMAASFELRSVSEVLTLRTCGAAVSSLTKA